MTEPATLSTIQPIESQSVKEQAYQPPYRDPSRVSRAAKSALILIAQIWRIIPYSLHLFVNFINSKIWTLANLVNIDYRYSPYSKWHENQQKVWDSLKDVKKNIVFFRWKSRNNEVVLRDKIRAPGILRIFVKALWYSPAKPNEEVVIQDKPERPVSVAEEKVENDDGN